jgi:type II secretory pathway pseudopilin PulG
MKPDNNTPSRRRETAVTLLELLAVVLIIAILSTIATGVYTNQTLRARRAATRDLIRQLEIGITRYEVDLGVFPPSGSSTQFPAANIGAGNAANYRDGSGMLNLALVHSVSGNAYQPASTLWNGPYVTIQAEQTAAGPGGSVIGNFDVLDPFGSPLIYVNTDDYQTIGTDFTGGAELFGAAVAGANPDLPAPNPHLAQGETYYNPSTYQIISYGQNSVTLTDITFKGAEFDDIANFGY